MRFPRFTKVFLTVLLVPGLTAAPVCFAAEDPGSRDQCIILLHGLARSSVSMKAVEWRLEEEGYFVVNNSYPWLGKNIEEIAPPAVEEGLTACREAGKSQVGFVTHSMGGIVLRQYLQSKSIAGMWRVVMLAPPNQGSMMADQLMANEMIEPLLPKPARQLGTGDNSIPKMLGPVDFELGIIAGSNTRTIGSVGLDEVENDGTVAVEETYVEGMQDIIVMPVDHSFLMWRSEVLDQVVQFLHRGNFDHAQAEEAMAGD
jgi:hypothetical protein